MRTDRPRSPSGLLRKDLMRFREVFSLSSGTGRLQTPFLLFSPRFLPVLLFRISSTLRGVGVPVLPKVFSSLNLMIFGLEIGLDVRIGGGLVLPHTVGTVIGAAEIGENVTIFQGVTLGAKSLQPGFDPATRPMIGNGVVIGAGAKVLGGLSIGDGVVIGANAVVLTDLRPGTVAGGIPAQEIERGAQEGLPSEE